LGRLPVNVVFRITRFSSYTYCQCKNTGRGYCTEKNTLYYEGEIKEETWDISPNVSKEFKLREIWAGHLEHRDKLNSCKGLARKTRRERTLERCRREKVHNSTTDIKIILRDNLGWKLIRSKCGTSDRPL
jgi:hypothetical protein